MRRVASQIPKTVVQAWALKRLHYNFKSKTFFAPRAASYFVRSGLMPPPATPNLPTPDFTFDPNAPGACIAGVRPFRNGSYRLEGLPISNKFFVHNYGHGGFGITLIWGCAAK